MEAGYTKNVNIMFTFDSDNRVIDGTKEILLPNGERIQEKDSRFIGVTWFNEHGEKSRVAGKSSVLPIPYAKMTEQEKAAFDELIAQYQELASAKSAE